ncbi:hypothetical protein SRIMHP_40410 (plasmid) [Streptomyces rimosus subsp. rimosus]|nr:hypothetical protein SRIMR7_41965 [Streptomyces rimosus subsp. rimosus]UTI00413.1 hypothetical protein SRIMHP_40410 [Streptomyces rimosus subsp. rimosus]UTJ18510.1 hypothetical protein SRIMDV3_40305 [Streptomyces rimosus subsp. rimosus]
MGRARARLSTSMLLPSAPDARASGAWIAPLVSTIVTLPIALFFFGLVGLSAMACDSCGGEEAQRYSHSVTQGVVGLLLGLVVAGVFLAVSWVLPWRQRNAARRTVFAVLAPCILGLSCVVFFALVARP